MLSLAGDRKSHNAVETKSYGRTRIIHRLIAVVCVVTLVGCAKSFTDEEHVQRAKEFQDEGNYRAAVIELKNALAQNRDNVEARWLLGNLYLTARNGVAAEKELRRAKDLGIADDALAVPMAKAIVVQGDYGRALREAKPSASLPPAQNAALYGIRAQALMAQGKLEAAEQDLNQALAFDPPPLEAQLAKARLLAVYGKLDEAKQWLDKTLAAAPKSVEAWSTLGDVERDRRNLDAAEAAYTKAVESGFGGVSERLKRALVRIVQRDYEGASKDLDQVQRMRPDVPGYYYAKGLIALRKKQYADAQSALERTLTLDPGYDPALFYLGVAHASQDHLEQADHYLARYATSHPNAKLAAEMLARVRLRKADAAGAQLALNTVLSRGTQDAETFDVLADVALVSGDYGRGIQYLRERAQLGEDSAMLRTKLGVAYLGEGEREKGIEQLEQALKLDPKFTGAKVALILDYIAQGKFDAAIKASEELQTNEPENPYAYTLAGVAQGRKGQEEQAIAEFEQALKLRPGDPTASLNVAAYALRDGDQAKARQLYEEVLKQHPGYLHALLRLAKLDAQAGKPERSLERLEAAVTANPTSLEARLLLARAYLTMARPSEAIRVAEQGLKLDAASAPLLEIAAAAYLNADNAPAAVQKFRALVQVQPERAEAHFMLAEAYGKAQQPAAMKAQLEKALKLDPKYFAARRVLARALIYEGQVDEAEKHVKLLKEQAPQDPDVLALEAAVATGRGQPEKALSLYQSLFERAPSTASMLSLAREKWERGDRDGALHLQQQWLADHPEDTRARLALAETLTALQKHGEAMEQYEQVLSRDRSNLLALNNLAWGLKESAPRKALTYAERAATLAPDSLAALDTFAMVLLSNGDVKQAERTSERLWAKLNKKQVTPDLAYHRALVLAQSGRAQDAKALLNAALQKYAAFAERPEAEQLLKELDKK